MATYTKISEAIYIRLTYTVGHIEFHVLSVSGRPR